MNKKNILSKPSHVKNRKKKERKIKGKKAIGYKSIYTLWEKTRAEHTALPSPEEHCAHNPEAMNETGTSAFIAAT